MTARMRADTFSGRCRLKVATANAQTVSISSQSRIEPSWLPQVAAIRYCSGRVLFELVATLRTEKSLATKLSARQKNANATSANSSRADGRASAIQSARPRAAPTIGMTPSTAATPRAIQRAK